MSFVRSPARTAVTFLVGLFAFVAAGCASTDVAGNAGDAPAPAAYETVTELAHSLGVTIEPSSAAGRIALAGIDGSRILLFTGTSVATVAGTRVDLSEPVTESRGESWLAEADAREIRATWFVRPRARTSPGATAAAPPPPPRPPVAGPPTLTAPLAPPPEASAAERAAWGVSVRRDWRYIVIHHSASAVGNASQIHRWHLDQGWDGLGYHFVIGNGTGSPDGAVEVGFRWRQQREGAHAKTKDNYMNEHGIGICLVGDFEKGRPSPAQMRSLERLCAFLSVHCRIPESNLRLHGEVKSTQCPGRYFPRDFAFSRPASGGRTAAAEGGHSH